MRALVIDDSRAMRAALSNILSSEGFKVIEAGDGQQALDILEKDPAFDLALVDWHMPVMDGITFLKTARERSALSKIVFVMVTSETEMSNVYQAIDAGAKTYIVKPINPNALLDVLEDLGLL